MFLYKWGNWPGATKTMKIMIPLTIGRELEERLYNIRVRNAKRGIFKG